MTWLATSSPTLLAALLPASTAALTLATSPRQMTVIRYHSLVIERESLPAELGPAGYVIVWGLARCVHAATHFAALDTDTIAVQAGSVDIMYPA